MTADEVHIPQVRRRVDWQSLASALRQAGTFFFPAAVRVGNRYEIVAGERRWIAMVHGGLELRVHSITGWPDMLAWMIQDAKSEGAMVPSLIEAVEMIDRIVTRVETRKADSHDRTICEYLGVHVDRMREARGLFRWLAGDLPEEIRALAKREIRAVHAGKSSPGGAEGRIKRAIVRIEQVSLPVEVQRKALRNAALAALGLRDALASLGQLSDELTEAECKEWASQLGAGRLGLERIIRQLTN